MIEPRMGAVRLHFLGDPARPRDERIPTPQPARDGVRVRVQAVTRDELE
jgi:NADPH:quinone reductase-like Zn-dependent oxidoreductase